MDRHPSSLDPQSHTWLELADVQRLLLDSHPSLALGLGLDGRIRWLNPAAEERLGYKREELHGREFSGSLIAPEDLEQRAAQLSSEFGETVMADPSVFSAHLQRGASSDEHEWVLRHKDGSPQPARLAMGALRDHQGQLVGLLAIETSLRADDETRLKLTHHDSLTGLPTRSVLPDRAEMALQRATRQRTVVAFMVIELSGFRALCAEQGHSVGDDVLRATASRLHFELRKTDTAVRWEHGQFIAMLVDLHQPDEAVRVANKIMRALSAMTNVGVARISLEARIGLAWFPEHGDQLLPLLEAAESALTSSDGETVGVAKIAQAVE